MSHKKALIFGATGLIGQELVSFALESGAYESVAAAVRSPLPFAHPKLTQHTVDFAKLDKHAAIFAVDDVFCCLGTTIHKAGSQEAFAKVDVDYPQEIARLAKLAGARHMAAVSSIGANAASRTFYLRMKGKMEESIHRFGPASVHVFRPSLLLGQRKETRIVEQLGAVFSRLFGFLMIGPLRNYKAIAARTVALAMHEAAQRPARGLTVYESGEIAEMVRFIASRP